MGKNIHGGNKNKKFAKGDKTASNATKKLRLKEDEMEKYAIVVSLSGGKICRIKTIENAKEIMCHIRGKFSGRNKSSNIVSVGSVVLVGFYSDLTTKQECDLLYIYEKSEIEDLYKYYDVAALNKLVEISNSSTTTNNNLFGDEITFTNQMVEIEFTKNISSCSAVSATSVASATIENEIDIDDI
jgi:translation initiation factor IF-1